MPLFRKSVTIVSVSIGALEIKDSFIEVVNVTSSTPARTVAGVRGISCSLGLLSSYYAKTRHGHGHKKIARICCSLSCALYLVSGGDRALALLIAYF